MIVGFRKKTCSDYVTEIRVLFDAGVLDLLWRGLRKGSSQVPYGG